MAKTVKDPKEKENEIPEKPEIFIPAEALEKVDLDISDEDVKLELAASQLAQALKGYHNSATQLKAARHAENHTTAETLAKDMAVLRNLCALLQYTYPTSKLIAEDIMRGEIVTIRRNRKNALDS